jgi:hypothetical protein
LKVSISDIRWDMDPQVVYDDRYSKHPVGIATGPIQFTITCKAVYISESLLKKMFDPKFNTHLVLRPASKKRRKR